MTCPKKCDELIMLPYGSEGAVGGLGHLPTICLVFIESDLDRARFYDLCTQLIGQGAISFITAGPIAKTLEGLIDDVIESSDDLTSRVVTASSDEEDLSQLATFFLRYTYFGSATCRYLAIIEAGPDGDLLKEEVLRIHAEKCRERKETSQWRAGRVDSE